MKKLLSSLLALCMPLSRAVLPASALELEDAKALLAEYYFQEIPAETLALDDLEALLDALGDPYTFYMDLEQIHQHDQSVDGPVRVGVGITVQSAYDGGYRITAVAPGGPAGEAGVLPGDLLTTWTASTSPRRWTRCPWSPARRAQPPPSPSSGRAKSCSSMSPAGQSSCPSSPTPSGATPPISTATASGPPPPR